MFAEGRHPENISDTTSLYAVAVPMEMPTGDERVRLCVAKLDGPSRGHRVRILLLHGNPSNLDDWRDIAGFLSAECEVAAIDLPGFGRSERVVRRADESRLDAAARCIVSLADALGWHEPFFLVGHSHGAAVAQILAGDYPDRVAGLVLIGTLGAAAHPAYRLLAFPGTAGLIGVWARLLRNDWFARLCLPLLARIMRPVFYPAPLSSEIVNERLREFVARPQILVSMVDVALGFPSEQLLENTAKIRSYTLFIHGAEDSLVPVDYARALYRSLEKVCPARTEFEVVSGAGHMVLSTHAPQIQRRILEWVRLSRGEGQPQERFAGEPM